MQELWVGQVRVGMTEDREAIARLFIHMIIRAKNDIKEFADKTHPHYQSAVSFLFDDKYWFGLVGEEITLYDVCKFMNESIRGLRKQTLSDLGIKSKELL